MTALVTDRMFIPVFISELNNVQIVVTNEERVEIHFNLLMGLIEFREFLPLGYAQSSAEAPT